MVRRIDSLMARIHKDFPYLSGYDHDVLIYRIFTPKVSANELFMPFIREDRQRVLGCTILRGDLDYAGQDESVRVRSNALRQWVVMRQRLESEQPRAL